jgi:WD40 repeat protein
MVLTGCDDGSVWVWDIGNRLPTPKFMLQHHRSNLFTTNFLTGTRFISGGNDASVQVVEIHNDGRVTAIQYIKHHIRKVHSSFVVDENIFATCAHDRTVRLFDIRTPYRNQNMTEIPLLSLEDFNYIGYDRLCHDLHTYRIRAQGDGGGPIDPIDPSEIDDTSLLINFKSRRGAELCQMDVHPVDRRRFLTCGCDGTVRLFDLRVIRSGSIGNSGFSVNAHYGQEMIISGAVYDPTGDRIAATVLGGGIHILDSNSFVDLAAIPDPPYTAYGYVDGGFNIVSRLRRQYQLPPPQPPIPPVPGEIIELKGHRSQVTLKACNWFGKFVVTGTDVGTMFFYDPDDGKIVNVVGGHREHVNVVAVHQEKKLIATSGVDYEAMLWEPQNIAKIDAVEVDRAARRLKIENDRRHPLNEVGCLPM